MSQGWVKSHREVMQHAVWVNDALYKTLNWCIYRAAHKDMAVEFNTGGSADVINIKRGQFIFGRFTAAKELKHKPASVWKRIKKLESLNIITLKSSKRYSIITVVNYNLYQSNETSEEQASSMPVASEEQASSTNKNVKNVKNKKKKERARSIFSFPVDGQDDDWTLPQDKLDQWNAAFETIGVEAQIGLARQWLVDNPTRQKTANGMTRFLGSWLTRACNSNAGANGGRQQPAIPKGIPAHLLPGAKP